MFYSQDGCYNITCVFLQHILISQQSTEGKVQDEDLEIHKPHEGVY